MDRREGEAAILPSRSIHLLGLTYIWGQVQMIRVTQEHIYEIRVG